MVLNLRALLMFAVKVNDLLHTGYDHCDKDILCGGVVADVMIFDFF